MNTKIRAKVLIPTLLFLAVALPAMLIPTIQDNQVTPSSDAIHDTTQADPVLWETDSNTSNTVHQLNPGEVNRYLDHFLGE